MVWEACNGILTATGFLYCELGAGLLKAHLEQQINI
jgi:hypothetical protein